MATSSSWPNEPPASSTSLCGDLATRVRLPQMSRALGRSLSAASLRSRGTARTRPATRANRTAVAIQLEVVMMAPDLRHGGTGQARSHGHVGLMLDLLEPGDDQARPGVPVQQEPARLSEQPGIGRVPAVDHDTEATGPVRPAYPGRLELR